MSILKKNKQTSKQIESNDMHFAELQLQTVKRAKIQNKDKTLENALR